VERSTTSSTGQSSRSAPFQNRSSRCCWVRMRQPDSARSSRYRMSVWTSFNSPRRATPRSCIHLPKRNRHGSLSLRRTRRARHFCSRPAQGKSCRSSSWLMRWTNRRSSSPGSGGLLQGEQSSHQRAAQLTAGLGVEQQRVATDDRPAHACVAARTSSSRRGQSRNVRQGCSVSDASPWRAAANRAATSVPAKDHERR
jgi:hypothetical protein